MATVTGLTATRMLAIEAASVVSGEIDETGHLILTTYGGTEIDAGDALVAVPDENIIQYPNADVITQATPPSSYPLGVSLMHLTSDQHSAGGWTNFLFKWGSIRTIKTDTSEAAQIWMHHHDASAESELWIRGGNWNGWGAWRRLLTTVDSDALDLRLDTIEDTTYKVITGGTFASGQWYRIATLPSGYVKASAEFVISTDLAHNFLRIRAGVTFNSARATLSVEECTGLDVGTTFSQVRLVSLNGLADGHALEILCQVTPAAGSSVRIQVKHDDWKGGSGALAVTRWGTIGFATTASTPTAPATVLMSRGIGYTGNYIAPTLANSWVNFGSPYGDAGYRMGSGNLVRLRGVVKNGTINGTAEMFTLPAGYRPDVRQLFATCAGAGTLGRIDIWTDGKVLAMAGNNAFMGLDGITFLATQ